MSNRSLVTTFSNSRTGKSFTSRDRGLNKVTFNPNGTVTVHGTGIHLRVKGEFSFRALSPTTRPSRYSRSWTEAESWSLASPARVWRRRESTPAVEAAGLTHRFPYALRHSFAAWSIAAGIGLFG
jgi:integrase